MKLKTQNKIHKSVHSYAEEVLGVQYDHHLNTMLAIYADCYDGLEKERVEINGNPTGTTDLLNAEEFLRTAKHMPQYNNFRPTFAQKILEFFGKLSQFRIAREGSPAIYIRPRNRVWMDRQSTRDLIKALQIDEISAEPNGEIRLWWD